MFKNKSISLFALLALVMLGAFPLTTFAAKNADAVRVTLDFGQTAFASDESVPVNVSIRNEGKTAVRILRWLTPIDGVKDDLFAVTIDGRRVEYIGADYKRAAPTDKDYVTLEAGATLETTIDLAGYYDLSQTGFYQVSYEAKSIDGYPTEIMPRAGAEENQALRSETAQAWISGRETLVPFEPMMDAVSGSTSFTGCSTSRQSSLVTARNNASTYSANSYNYLAAGTVGARYTTWFGSYTSSRYSTVRSHYSNIRNAMDTASVRFNCTCTDSAYAYVYPTQPYTIYLCNAFWNAPSTGTDSKAGTLVHEMSHFNVVAGTDDWAYGQSAAKSLARSNPTRAVDNADSHEYFAENTPAQQ